MFLRVSSYLAIFRGSKQPFTLSLGICKVILIGSFKNCPSTSRRFQVGKIAIKAARKEKKCSMFRCQPTLPPVCQWKASAMVSIQFLTKFHLILQRYFEARKETLRTWKRTECYCSVSSGTEAELINLQN